MIPRKIELNFDKSLLLLGSRQSGKSTLIKSILSPDESLTINLLYRDQFQKYLKNPSLLRKELNLAIEKRPLKWVFIDEIQKIPELMDEVHALIEETHLKFILTGSSARKLKRGHTNLLGARALMFHLFPFIFLEIEKGFELDSNLIWGSLPGIYFDSPKTKVKALKTYAQTYLKEEIQEEGAVRNLAPFALFLDLAAQNFGEIISYSNISRECHVGYKTVQSYYQILEDTLIAYRLPSWEKSLKKIMVAHSKYYFFDNGVCNALNKQIQNELSPLLRGKLFEQWLVQQVKAQLSYQESDCDLYFWRTKAGAEVDLLLAKAGQPLLACEIKAKAQVSGADCRGLLSFLEEYPKTPTFLICEVDLPYQLEFGPHVIQVLPWQHFLKSELGKF